MEEFGYLKSNHPLLLRLTPSRLFPVHLQLKEQNILELGLAEWEPAVYALKIDETQSMDSHGNPELELDAEGHPQILPMGDGPIIRLKVGLMLAGTLAGPVSDPEDPTQLLFQAQVLGDQSRWVITPIAGSNATAIAPMNLVDNLKGKLDAALKDILGNEGQQIPIPLPKSFHLASTVYPEDSLMGLLGLERLTWGPQGLQLKLDSGYDRIEGLLAPIIEQNLPFDGSMQSFQLPEN